MRTKAILELACVIIPVGLATADTIRPLNSDGFTAGMPRQADIGTDPSGSAAFNFDHNGVNCQLTWARANGERNGCTYEFPTSLTTAGDTFTIAESETNGIFTGTLTRGCVDMLIRVDSGEPSVLDGLNQDCTGTVGGSSDRRRFCDTGSTALTRC
ncbi:uncharacterized protein B0I36DRAFT_341060 [Microdochium trichocladiopsis]|uniref:Uncharacterized protein n=1 Tax=Microdochium trichocladiopsis TaxID=1682393 RepID=A0A9P9BI93_9PEZI|nr:uncharacterized protein B0I36DRAFT_341060 [Microdochium trichocladiopsis]KAH7010803.1 hypothetical protein B0I36DRAFT_341060 [Microdochium trichocladiopsis]